MELEFFSPAGNGMGRKTINKSARNGELCVVEPGGLEKDKEILPLQNRQLKTVGLAQPLSNNGRRVFGKQDLMNAVRRVRPLLSKDASLDSNVSRGRQNVSKGPGKSGANKVGSKPPGEQSSIVNQLKLMESGINSSSRRYNELRHTSDVKEEELKRRRDIIAMLKVEATALKDMQIGRTPASAFIHQLRESITEKDRDAQSKVHYMRVLQHILNRQETNKIKLSAHLNGMQDTLGAVDRELGRVEDLKLQLETGETRAIQLLHETEREVSLVRAMRSKVGSNKEAQAQASGKMESWRKEREEMRIAVSQQLRGDLSPFEEQALIHGIAERETLLRNARSHTEALNQEVATMEGVLTRVRHSIGSSSFEEVLCKIANQAAMKESLAKEKHEAESRAATLRQEWESLGNQFRDLKVSGIGATELNRGISDELNCQVSTLKRKTKGQRTTYQQLEEVLVGVRQGVLALYERLQPLTHLVMNINAQDNCGTTLGAQCDEEGDKNVQNITGLLRRSETILIRLSEEISTNGRVGKPEISDLSRVDTLEEENNDGGDEQDASLTIEMDGHTFVDDHNNKLGNNVRVQSIAQRAGDKCVEGSTSAIRATPVPQGGDWDNSTITSGFRPMGKERVRGDEIEIQGGGYKGKEESETLTGAEDDQECERKEIESKRYYVKMCSNRDAQRNLQESSRRERNEWGSQVGNDVTGGTKGQNEHIEKISQPHRTVGLPEGLSQRADIYTKSAAFLGHVPKLE